MLTKSDVERERELSAWTKPPKFCKGAQVQELKNKIK